LKPLQKSACVNATSADTNIGAIVRFLIRILHQQGFVRLESILFKHFTDKERNSQDAR